MIFPKAGTGGRGEEKDAAKTGAAEKRRRAEARKQDPKGTMGVRIIVGGFGLLWTIFAFNIIFTI